MRKIHLLFVLLPGFLSVAAKDPVLIHPEPAWLYKVNADLAKKPAANNISDGYYYALIDRQVNLVNQTKYFHFIRQIVNESGVQDASEVSAYFSPEFQQVIFHKVCIIRNGEVINRLVKKDIKVVQEETEASDYQYTGIKRAYITLKDVQKTDQVEFSYSIVGFNPVFSNKYSEEFYFNTQTAASNYFLTLITEPSRKLYIKNFNNAPAPVLQSGGPFKIYQWNNPEMVIGQTESNSPSWFTSDPYVCITEYENWGQVVDWGLKIFNNYQYPIPGPLETRIAEWQKASGGDPDMFANLALRFVQDQVRYLGLEIGVYTHHPHPPSDVFNRRFGDCKDKALLLATILNHEHISAYVALVNTEEKEKLIDDPPAATGFDHAIVALKRSSGYVFVDPTISMQRGELINAFIPAYGYALILRPGETQLQPVEPGFLYNTSITESANVLDSDSSWFSVKTVYSGGAADDMRSYFASTSQKEIGNRYTKYYADIFEGIGLLKPVQTTDDSLKNELLVEESYGIPVIWQKQDGGKREINFFAKSLSSIIPDPGSHADAPIALPFPQSIQYDLLLRMPMNFPASIKGLHVKNASYQFDFVPDGNGNQLSYHYKFKTFRDFIPAEDILQYKKDYKEMNSCLSLSFSINDGSASKTFSSPDLKRQPEFNWILVWIAFFFGVAFTVLTRFLNRRTVVREYSEENGWPLGGWTILLGITIGLKIVFQAYISWQQHYFFLDTWTGLGNMGGARLQALFVFELFLALFSLGGAIALLYWFLNRRDIFPKLFVYYISTLFALQFLYVILYYQIPVSANVKQSLFTNLFRSIIYGLIWITYIMRSERVKNTFVFPPNE